MAFRLHWISLLLAVAACNSTSTPAGPEEETSDTSSSTSADDSSTGAAESTGADGTAGSTTSPEVPECASASDCNLSSSEVDCRTASCVASQCVYEDEPDETPCNYEDMANGLCWGGYCHYGCFGPEDCDVGTCVEPLCVKNWCVAGEPLDGVDAPEENQTAGNCAVTICVAGMASIVDDPSDPMDDRDPCTIDACVDGMTTHELAPEGTPCDEVGGTCDATGACVAPR